MCVCVCTQTLGAWEQHTRGVASNIMRRMGYVQGAGLGMERA